MRFIHFPKFNMVSERVRSAGIETVFPNFSKITSNANGADSKIRIPELKIQNQSGSNSDAEPISIQNQNPDSIQNLRNLRTPEKIKKKKPINKSTRNHRMSDFAEAREAE